MIRLLGRPAGRRLLVREFENSFARESGIPDARLEARALTGLSKDTVGLAISVQTPRGPFAALMMTIRVGHAVETLAGFGPAAGVAPQDLERLAEKARARLDANLPRS